MINNRLTESFQLPQQFEYKLCFLLYHVSTFFFPLILTQLVKVRLKTGLFQIIFEAKYAFICFKQ